MMQDVYKRQDLEAADITSASVRLSPPDTTIQIVETEELVSYINEVVIYNKDNSYTEYAGQAVIFTLSLACLLYTSLRSSQRRSCMLVAPFMGARSFPVV